ncbi:MAG: AMP-binding protein [Gammaproteobacteria bacterium]|nr:AMP-binding protein [Gammaproteobacteria bacterium]
MDLHFASAWEIVADYKPNSVATVCDGEALTWREFEQHAACVAALLHEHGLGPDSKAGLYLHNSNEYQEAQFGIFKIGGCPINVNYRYKSDELVHLLDNSDAEAIFFQACYAMRIWEIKDRLPKIKLFVQINDGTEALLDFAVDYERSVRNYNPLPRQQRDPDGIYMLYTGGTTGLPKGVMYPVGGFTGFLAGMGAAARDLTPPTELSKYGEFVGQIESPPICLVGCPLMHGTGAWLGSFLTLLMGGTVVTTSKLGLDADLFWSMTEAHGVTDIVIVGDAFARPMLAALDAAKQRGTPYDISCLKQICSSGVMWSKETKQGLLAHHDMALVDIMGSSEGGMGSSVTTRDETAQTAKFKMNKGVKVISDDGRMVEPGSGEVGKLATSAFVPLGYYKDAEKSAAIFREVDGVRYSFPGDYATIEADGTIVLLGRGSVCINTAGEKVFPEEVEEAIKRHPSVLDCLVVGLADERFGERIVAVTSCVEYQKVEEADLIEFVREQLAGYKVPKQVLMVDVVRRAANGKPDYKWAKAQAQAELGGAVG